MRPTSYLYRFDIDVVLRDMDIIVQSIIRRKKQKSQTVTMEIGDNTPSFSPNSPGIGDSQMLQIRRYRYRTRLVFSIQEETE